MEKTDKSTEPVKEVILEKIYDAPIEEVWHAWTDPEMIKKWWGPNDVTTPEAEIDLRIGGRIYIVMEGGEAMGEYKGTMWPMLGKYTDVKLYSHLAYDVQAWTEGLEDQTTIDQTTDINFIEEDKKTKVVVKATIHKTGPKAGMAVDGMQYGFTQQLEKLDKFLSENKK